MLLWMKQMLTCSNLQLYGAGNELTNIKDTFTEGFQFQISVLHQVFKYVCLQGWPLKFE